MDKDVIEKIHVEIDKSRQVGFFRRMFQRLGWGRTPKKTEDSKDLNPHVDDKDNFNFVADFFSSYLKDLGEISVVHSGADRLWACVAMYSAYSESGYLQDAIQKICDEVTGDSIWDAPFIVSDDTEKVLGMLDRLGINDVSWVKKVVLDIVMTGFAGFRKIIDYRSKKIVGLEYIDALQVRGVVMVHRESDGGLVFTSGNVTLHDIPDLVAENVNRLFADGRVVDEEIAIGFLVYRESKKSALLQGLLGREKAYLGAGIGASVGGVGVSGLSGEDDLHNSRAETLLNKGVAFIPIWEVSYVAREDNPYAEKLGFPMFYESVYAHRRLKSASDINMLLTYSSIPKEVIKLPGVNVNVSPSQRFKAVVESIDLYYKTNADEANYLGDDSMNIGRPSFITQDMEHIMITPPVGGVLNGLIKTMELYKKELVASTNIPYEYLRPEDGVQTLSGEALANISQAVGIKVVGLQTLVCRLVSDIVSTEFMLNGESVQDFSVELMYDPMKEKDSTKDKVLDGLEKVKTFVDSFGSVEQKKSVLKYLVENSVITNAVAEFMVDGNEDEDGGMGFGGRPPAGGGRRLRDGVPERPALEDVARGEVDEGAGGLESSRKNLMSYAKYSHSLLSGCYEIVEEKLRGQVVSSLDGLTVLDKDDEHLDVYVDDFGGVVSVISARKYRAPRGFERDAGD